ncbi:MAG: hypothetical protein GY906_21155 [bacterium]|nr:hypothetical protein [bacterium]
MSDAETFRKAIEFFGEQLALVYDKDSEWTRRFKAGDNQTLHELVVAACRQVGITPDQYADAIDSDPMLDALQNLTITKVILAAESTKTTPAPPKWWQFWKR